MTQALLGRLLREPPSPILADDVGAWWHRLRQRTPAGDEPIDLAVIGGFSADRAGFALAAGYEAALRALVSTLAPDAIASFCATEERGNQPRAIDTRLERDGDGHVVTGRKRWSTMGLLADVLLVVACEGEDADGRKRLRVATVDARSAGVARTSMPPTTATPEVPHAAIALERARVERVLPGDGYARYVKPFRTVEDLHIHGAVLGYLVSVARRHAFPRDAIEALAASVVTTRALGRSDPAAPEVHVALAGLLSADARLVEALEPAWSRVEEHERARWQRDRALFGSVARQVRELRRARAWEQLASG